MRSLLRFIFKYHFTLFFILIEALSFYLIITYNSHQNRSYLTSANQISGSVYDSYSSFTDYLALKDANKSLADENAQLKMALRPAFKSSKVSFQQIHDSIYQQQYVHTPARVINNSVNRKCNYLTLNKGRKQGVHPDMAVVSSNGVVGVVSNVSDNFSTIISILNSNLKVSSKIKKNGYFGSLVWDEKDYRKAVLHDIPSHVDVEIGDTVVTSGYSSMFPEGEMVGVVSDFQIKKGSSFLEITVELATDFKNISYVFVIGDLLQTEQDELENQLENV